MQVNNVSFGNVYIGYTLTEKLASSRVSKKLVKDITEIRYLLAKSKIDRLRYVDIILQKGEDGFYGVIHSKKYGVPINPDCRHFISTQSEKFAQFVKWVKDWNSAYSPKAMARYNDLLDSILNFKK